MLREDPMMVVEKLKIKNFDAQPIVDKVLELDTLRRALLADRCGLNIDAIILEKLKQNAEKYPVEKACGTAKKYTELI